MPKIRTTTLEKYNISKYRYMELIYFCLQYNEWKKMIEDENIILCEIELKYKCKLIEQTAIEADAELYPYILKAVTNEGVSYNYLKMVYNIPCGKDVYYDRRRKFYCLLSEKCNKMIKNSYIH